MSDLMLSENGDLIFIEDKSSDRFLNIMFSISPLPVLRLKFNIENCIKNIRGDNSLSIKFKTTHISNSNKKAMVITGAQELAQTLRIRLETAKGELSNRLSVGSELENMRHKPLFSETSKKEVIKIVKAAINDIAPDVSIKVSPNVDKTVSYSQRMDIYIYDADSLILKYSVEG